MPDTGELELARRPRRVDRPSDARPRAAAELHLLDVVERWLVVAGTGLVEIGPGHSMRIAIGDVVVIPPGTPERVVNEGDEPLMFYCICTPRFRPDSYMALAQHDEPADP